MPVVLPLEVIGHIFSFLGIKEKKNGRLVSTSFQNLLDNLFLTFTLSVEEVSECFMKELPRKLGYFKYYGFETDSNILQDSHLSLLPKSLLILEVLWAPITNSGILQL